MGATASSEGGAAAGGAAPLPPRRPVDHPTGGAGKCPVDHKNASAADFRLVEEALGRHQGAAAGQATVAGRTGPKGAGDGAGGGAAPTDAGRLGGGGGTLDPLREVPLADRQKPIPGQRFPLSTERVVSSIPKGEVTPSHQPAAGAAACPHASDSEAYGGAGGGAAEAGGEGGAAGERWTYPSQQMFFNAMKRKGWQGVREEDIPQVVAIHNAVNERSWLEVMRWERLHESTCPTPILLKFQGRPNDLSPKARLKTWLGYAAPFDRHDWVVDRCGTQVRYVIDFYRGKRDPTKPVAFHLDVRPAIDSPGALLDRVRMAVAELVGTDGAVDITSTSNSVSRAPAAPLPEVRRSGTVVEKGT